MRIASSLIQKREEKYKRNALGITEIRVDESTESWLRGGLEPEEERLLDIAYEKAEAAVKGDAELEKFLEAIRDCGTCTEMCQVLNCDKPTIYNMKKRFIRRLKGIQVS